jgi:hypothetical protein
LAWLGRVLGGDMRIMSNWSGLCSWLNGIA